MSRRRDAAAAAADDAAADAGRPSDLRSSSPNLRSSSLCGEWRCGDGGRRGGDGDHLYELGDIDEPRADSGRLPRFGERRAVRGDAEWRGTGGTSGGAGSFVSSLVSAAANCAGTSGGAAAIAASLAGLEGTGGALGGATVGLKGLEAAALLGGAARGAALLGRDGAFAESSGRRG